MIRYHHVYDEVNKRAKQNRIPLPAELNMAVRHIPIWSIMNSYKEDIDLNSNYDLRINESLLSYEPRHEITFTTTG